MKRTTARAAIDALVRHGVTDVFGIPGAHNLSLYDALASTPIRHVLARHEQGVAFAADGYARASGRAGVCILTSGPGVLNALAAAATAYADSIPMILLSPGMPNGIDGRDTGMLHETKNQHAAVDSVVAWSRRVSSASEAEDAIADAFEAFAGGRPRPVHIEIPLDAMDVEADAAVRRVTPAARPRAGDVEAAIELLARAKRPGIVVGGGCVDASGAATAVAERLMCGVATTVNGKGVVPESHPLSLGASMRLPAARAYLEDCDVLLAVGTELAESDLWGEPLHTRGRVIRVDIDEAQLAKNTPCTIGITADAEAALLAIAAGLPSRGARTDAVAALKREIDRQTMVDCAPWRPLIEAMRAAIPADAILCADNTQAAYYGAVHLYRVERPRRFAYATGYAALGHALPAAIGAAVARPNAAAAVLVGDGGLMFTLPELAVAVDEGMPIAIVVVVSGGYSVIKQMMEERGMAPFGVDFPAPDLRRLADAFSCAHDAPRSASEMERAIRSALGRSGPTLVEWRVR